MKTIDQAFVEELYKNHSNLHAIDHIMRVTNLAVKIANEEKANIETVRVASLLHDICKGENNHHMRSASKARSILEELGFSASSIDAISHCIEAHSYNELPEPQTIEAMCVSDADKLDAIGAIGIARTFAWAGKHNTLLWSHSLETLQGQVGENPQNFRSEFGGNQWYTPAHEYICKLEIIGKQMYTNAGSKIARKRLEFMASFFQQLDNELADTR